MVLFVVKFYFTFHGNKREQVLGERAYQAACSPVVSWVGLDGGSSPPTCRESFESLFLQRNMSVVSLACLCLDGTCQFLSMQLYSHVRSADTYAHAIADMANIFGFVFVSFCQASLARQQFGDSVFVRATSESSKFLLKIDLTVSFLLLNFWLHVAAACRALLLASARACRTAEVSAALGPGRLPE